jgi:hypothetical protein
VVKDLAEDDRAVLASVKRDLARRPRQRHRAHAAHGHQSRLRFAVVLKQLDHETPKLAAGRAFDGFKDRYARFLTRLHETGGPTTQLAEPGCRNAEAHFQRALTVAREQRAKSWELRTAMSLAQLWRDRAARVTRSRSCQVSMDGSPKASRRLI